MKTVLITGANKGIGFETAKQMAQLGYFVYVGSRDKTKGSDAINKLKDLGISNVELIEIDVTNINSIKQAKRKLENQIEVLDVLINNAGISGGLVDQNMSTFSMDNLREVFETNFFGAVQTTQQFIDLLKKSSEPRIVNISSGLGSLNFSNSHNMAFYAYGCSKTALNAFTVSLAKEFRNTDFRINSIEPGYTATNLNEYQGTQTVEEAVGIIIKYATAGSDAPTGKFLWKEGEFAW